MRHEKRQTLPMIESEHEDDDFFSPKKRATIAEALEEPDEESSAHEISSAEREENRQLLSDHAEFMYTVTLLGHLDRNSVNYREKCSARKRLQNQFNFGPFLRTMVCFPAPVTLRTRIHCVPIYCRS